MKRLNSWHYYLGFAFMGVVGGMFWWYNFGCTESCPIDASPLWSSVRGGLLGASLAGIWDSFVPFQKKINDETKVEA